jgi:hypothetical protein
LEKNGWQVLEPIKPGYKPLAKLERVFEKFFQGENEEQLDNFIHNHPDGLCPLIKCLPGSERFLLVVDQFEEVFTLCPKEKEEERRRFIELLTSCPPEGRLEVVLTMRADFLEPCLSYESLNRLIQEQVVLMPPLVGADLEEAIAKPANLQGYQLETGLLGAILQDVGQENGCLPLLQFTLTELWEQRDRETYQLTLAKYDELGGVIGSLNRHAEQIYQNFTNQEQKWVNRIFLKLVRTGTQEKDTRQRQPKAKLLAIAGDNPANREAISRVLDKLVDGRLLVTDREVVDWVDLTHEALMGGWERLVTWRQSDRELRRLVDLVEDALQEWLNSPKKENLMMGWLLAQVREKWSELESNLPSSAKEFYQKSNDYQREQQKIQDLLSSLSFALRSFNFLSQFLELIPLLAARVTDADGGALISLKPNGQVRLEQIHCPEDWACQNIRKAIEKAIVL